MTYNENIKTFDDFSRHLWLEAVRFKASKVTKVAKSGSAYVANNDFRTTRGPKRKNYTPK